MHDLIPLGPALPGALTTAEIVALGLLVAGAICLGVSRLLGKPP
jgi:hypothetical protein